jgi:hypothetical protein
MRVKFFCLSLILSQTILAADYGSDQEESETEIDIVDPKLLEQALELLAPEPGQDPEEWRPNLEEILAALRTDSDLRADVQKQSEKLAGQLENNPNKRKDPDSDAQPSEPKKTAK